MTMYLYRLRFKGPVHFGEQGIGLEETQHRVASDSVTSALINAFAVTGKADEAVDALTGDQPAFVLSSLFPFGPGVYGHEATLYALPKPMTPPLANPDVLAQLGKDLKRLSYITPKDLLRWLGNEPLEAQELEDVIKCSRQIGAQWDVQQRNGWWAEELRPRVALDRSSQNSAIWWCGILYFAPEAGLYGLVELHDENWLGPLELAFELLGEMGLGGERTYGLGSFEFTGFEQIDKIWESDMNAALQNRVLISRLYPAPDERAMLSTDLEAWDFEETRGYITSGRQASTLKRKRVRMLREGAVSKRSFKGMLVDVTPEHSAGHGLEHRVYRSGLGFWLPSGGQ